MQVLFSINLFTMLLFVCGCCQIFSILRIHIDGKKRRVVIGDVSFSKLRDFSNTEDRCTSPHRRWLAPESILEGEFTEKSDVVSNKKESGREEGEEGGKARKRMV